MTVFNIFRQISAIKTVFVILNNMYVDLQLFHVNKSRSVTITFLQINDFYCVNGETLSHSLIKTLRKRLIYAACSSVSLSDSKCSYILCANIPYP